MTSTRTVFVTGATGFIGRHLSRELLSRGWSVRALVRSEGSRLEAGLSPIFGDLFDTGALSRGTAGVDAVVHLAALVHVMNPDFGDADLYRRVNIEGTRKLLDAAVAARVPTFVLISSVKAVGEDNACTWSESVAASPADDYGRSKLEAEGLVVARAREQFFRAAVLRLPLVYGPGMRGNMLQLFEAVSRRLPLPFGLVRNRRSLAYVGNVVDAIVSLIESPPASPEIFFVADAETPSTPELIRGIGSALETRPVVLSIPVSWLKSAAWVADLCGRALRLRPVRPTLHRLLSSLTVDTTKLRSHIGHDLPYSLASGLTNTAKWYSDGRTGHVGDRASE